MRSVSSAFETAIAQGCVRICEIFTFELADGSTYRYTDHDKDITWDSGDNTYTSIEGVRGPIRFSSDGQTDECTINLANISGDLKTIAQNNGLDSAVLTIKRIRWDASYASDEEIQIFVGSPDVGYNSKEMTLNFRSIFSSLNIIVPAHTYQESCNHTLFDANCGLTRSDFAYSGTATSGSSTSLVDTTAGTLYKVDFDAGDSDNPIEIGDSIEGQTGSGTAVVAQIVYFNETAGRFWYIQQSGTQFVDGEEIQNPGADAIDVNGTPVEDTTFYLNGEIEILTGDNAGQRRPIQIRSGSTITPKWPFISAIVATDTYKIYPGCDGIVASTCHPKFDNDPEWRGYPWIPKVEDVIF